MQGQCDVDFLVVGSVSVRASKERFVDSVDFVVISLTTLSLIILPPLLQQDSFSFGIIFGVGL